MVSLGLLTLSKWGLSWDTPASVQTPSSEKRLVLPMFCQWLRM